MSVKRQSSGAYRRRVSIQSQVPAPDTVGGQSVIWKTLWPDVPCSIEQFRNREYFAAQQMQADAGWTITIRWRPGLDTTMRCIEYTNQARTEFTIYNIEGVAPDATGRRDIDLNCRTVLNEGFRTDGQ
jgi:head-tail adaptor